MKCVSEMLILFEYHCVEIVLISNLVLMSGEFELILD